VVGVDLRLRPRSYWDRLTKALDVSLVASETLFHFRLSVPGTQFLYETDTDKCTHI
jgi:hypothetical protein